MNVVQSALSSPRFNRVLLWFASLVLAAGVALLVLKLAGGSDKTSYAPDRGFRPTLPANQKPLTNAQGVTVRTYYQLDAEVRQAIRTFIVTAVARRNLDRSWAVIAPSMKKGYTFTQWKNAKALPIVPFPVDDIDRANYYLDYASTQEILVEVGLSAKPKLKIRPTTFQIALNPVGPQKEWLVSYWMPRWTPPLPIN
jgi:hypothetical protein